MPKVDRDRPVKFFRGYRSEFVALVVGRVIDQDRGRAEPAAHVVERAAQRGDIGQVALHECRTGLVGERVPGVLLKIDKSDAGAVLRESADKGGADAAGTAGDDDRATVQ